MTAIDARTVHFEGVLHTADSETYITCPFDVPEGCAAIRLHFTYAPQRVATVRNLVSIGLFDPHGCRGQAHRGTPDGEIIVSADSATRGFVAGPLPAGRWYALLAVFIIMPDVAPCTYTLDVQTSAVPLAAAPMPPSSYPAGAPRTPQPGPRWYRGELHTHSLHSDGQCSVAEIVARARDRDLDFICLTDHNTISGWSDIAAAQADDLLIIPGEEMTTYYGHAVALGIDRWVNWRVGYKGWTMNDAARATRDAGGLFIIAHPWSIGTPACTGCRWLYDSFDMALADGSEVWSNRWPREDSHNPCNQRFWYEQTAAGHPLTAVAAADFHAPQAWSEHIPVTCVYAAELSAPAILEGIRQRRVMVTTGPWLEIEETGSRWVLLENVLTAGPVRTNVVAAWRGAPPDARLRIRQAATVLDEAVVGDQGRLAFAVLPGQTHAELWSADGVLLAMTNPLAVSSSAA